MTIGLLVCHSIWAETSWVADSRRLGGRGLRVAADIGGTFTDLVLFAADGTIATRKVQSTPDDYGRAVVEGLCNLLDEVGAKPADVSEVLHGCTIATNAILENRGARTALITTRGFRDVLEFRRIRVPRLYEPLYIKPLPLVPRELRFEVTERLAADGTVVMPLAEREVATVIAELHNAAVEAVAVCFLHSYVNAAHERRVGEMLQAALPDVFVTLSCDLLPEIREYERTSTAVINSYVGPPVSSYIAALDRGLKSRGVTGRLLIMQSSGGILDAETVMRAPARIVECGPAAGVIGAGHQAGIAGCPNAITLDMGGTTAKAAMIEDGRIIRTDEYEVGGGISLSSRLVKGGGYALKLPVIDISEVGAGGGSIVWFDKANALKVGPRSAGAVPGPVCYALGGTHATVTDANVVLGFLNPDALAGGTVPIRAELSHAAIRSEVGDRLGIPIEEAAWSVFVVAAANMMRAVKAVSTYRGRDPRDCVLMAFGGNGGVFAAELASQLQMRRILVPPAAGVFSAVGLGVAPFAFGQARAFLRRLGRLDPRELNEALASLAAAVTAQVGGGEVTLRREAAMRYIGQAFELRVTLPDGDFDADAITALRVRFETEHEQTYGHRLTDAEDVEMVALEVTAARVRANAEMIRARPGGHARPSGPREAYFGPSVGYRPTAVIDREELTERPRTGPLIIEEYEGTTVVPPGTAAHLDRFGNIVIELG